MNRLTLRRFLILGLLLALMVGFASCTQNAGTDTTPAPTTVPTEPSATQSSNEEMTSMPTTVPTQQPAKQPANNEKPDLLGANNKYKDVAIYDKFGAWPSKSGETYYDSDVGTWFTVWWTKEKETLYDQWFATDMCRLKPVDYGYYSSGDKDYLTSVFLRLNYIGIDFLMLDSTNGYGNYSGMDSRNMGRCFQVANTLGEYAPKIAIATGGYMRLGKNAEQQAEYDTYYKQYYQKYPNMYYHYEGKPLLLVYIAEFVNARYQDNQNRFTQRYGTGFISWQNNAQNQTIFKTQGNWGWVFDTQNKNTEIMGVQPGYNKAHQGVDIESFPRDNGKRYTQMWLEAIKANPKVIMIPSYNDHAEETGWEATTPIRAGAAGSAKDYPNEDPYVYEKITEAYLALRYGYIEGFFYKVEETIQVYQCVNGSLEKVDASKAGNEPIILLPKGYMEWEFNRNRG
ncbi:MAG: hypothetical protein IKV74_00710 [Clostridia bacterium]|nr:hypothetical protein [Clostridia bacterium]